MLQAAAGSPLGIGSDIGGSIRMPAFFNGIFGHKPSQSIVSLKGQWPMPNSDELRSFLCIGPMSRFASDLKPLLKVIAGTNADKLKLDEPVNLAKLKYYYQENDGGGNLISPVDHDIRLAMDKIIKYLQVTLKAKPQRVKLPKLRESIAIWLGNMKDSGENSGFDYKLTNMTGRLNPYIELVKWVIGASKHTFIALITVITEKWGVKHGSPEYYEQVQKRDDLKREFQDMLGTDGIFIYPAHPTVAPYHNEPLIRPFNFSYTAIINVLGLPSTAVPLGIGQEGVPLGVQIVANINQDRLCLAVANELERAFGGWVAPTIDI